MTLSITNLSASYGTIDALRDVSIAAERGRIVVLAGPNASGKTTLLRCIAGLMLPRSGTVSWNGTSVFESSIDARARYMTFVAQQRAVVRDFSVRDVVSFGRYALGRDDAAVQAAMDAAEVSDLAERPMQELSGGQQQRVALARAMAQVSDDGCLVLDEPTSALDLSHVRMAMELLRSCRDRGMTVVVSMHDLSVAAALADDVWLLNEGKLVAAGPTDDVMTPSTLASVFGVDFGRVSVDGNEILLPRF